MNLEKIRALLCRARELADSLGTNTHDINNDIIDDIVDDIDAVLEIIENAKMGEKI